MRYLVALFVFLLVAPSPHAQTWEAGPELNTARRRAAVAVLDGQLYVIGGRNAAGYPMGSVERLGDGGWGPVASLRDARYGAAAVAFDGRIVLIGGHDDNEVTEDVEAYVPEENDWESFQSLDQAREGLGAAVLGGRIYALGGATQSGALLASCEYYDTADDNWYPFPAWTLDPQRAAFGAVAADEVAYVAGGFSDFGPLDTAERYTLSTGTEPLPPMPTARGGLALATDGAALYAIGGLNADDEVLSVVERFDLQSGAWETIAPLNTARSGAVAAYVDGAIYVAGGRDALGNLLTSVEVLPLTPVAGEEEAAPVAVTLEAAYPNPFAGHTTFTLTLDEPAALSLRIYDVRGREVAVLLDGPVGAGTRQVIWDGRAADGRGLASGVYIARLAGASGTVTQRLTLLRR